jgi:CheY-like chemotaxis protein
VVADDDPVARACLATALADAGADVRGVADGRAAVLASVDGRCDLLVTDLDMPEVDGLQAVAILRWDFGLTGLPVLIVSSAAAVALPRLLEAGADACLTKPVTPTVLVRAVTACLQAVAPDAVPPVEAAGVPAGLLTAEETVERLGGRRELLADLFALFLDRHTDTPAAVAAALQRGDRAAARALVHALRGTAAQIGAMALRDAAARVEARLATAAPSEEAVAALDRAAAETTAVVRAWLAGHAPRPA